MRRRENMTAAEFKAKAMEMAHRSAEATKRGAFAVGRGAKSLAQRAAPHVKRGAIAVGRAAKKTAKFGAKQTGRGMRWTGERMAAWGTKANPFIPSFEAPCWERLHNQHGTTDYRLTLSPDLIYMIEPTSYGAWLAHVGTQWDEGMALDAQGVERSSGKYYEYSSKDDALDAVRKNARMRAKQMAGRIATEIAKVKKPNPTDKRHRIVRLYPIPSDHDEAQRVADGKDWVEIRIQSETGTRWTGVEVRDWAGTEGLGAGYLASVRRKPKSAYYNKSGWTTTFKRNKSNPTSKQHLFLLKRAGTHVVFDPTPAGAMRYSGRPVIGEHGVTEYRYIHGAGQTVWFKGPRGGNVNVLWDQSGPIAVNIRDLTITGQDVLDVDTGQIRMSPIQSRKSNPGPKNPKQVRWTRGEYWPSSHYNPSPTVIYKGKELPCGCGSRDDISVWEWAEYIHVLCVNTGLGYVGLKVFDLAHAADVGTLPTDHPAKDDEAGLVGEMFMDRDHDIEETFGKKGLSGTSGKKMVEILNQWIG